MMDKRNRTPMVSVIIPVYNGEKYLEECLESVIGQSYRNIEILAVNDGSTDLSRSILERWQKLDKRVRILDKENGGQSSARNLGISNSSGELVMFVDCDDVLYAEAISELVNLKEKDGSAIAVGLISKNQNRLGKKKGRNSEVSGLKLAEQIIYQTGKVIVHPCGQIFDKGMWEKTEYRFKEGLYYEDLELIPRIYANQKKISVLNETVYFYRQHSQSTIHAFSEKRFDALKATELLHAELKDINSELEKATEDRILSASFNIFLLLKGHPECKELADRTWENIKRYRKQSLANPKVRLKNKVGILVSFLGRRALELLG